MSGPIHCHACGTDGLTAATFMAHAEKCEKHPLAVALRETRQQRDDLLAALGGIVEIGKRDLSNPKYDAYFDEARAAIAKAKGGQP